MNRFFRHFVRVLCRILLLALMRDDVLWPKCFYQRAYRPVIGEWLQVFWMRIRAQWTVHYIERLLFAALYRHAWLWLMRFDLFVACVNGRDGTVLLPCKMMRIAISFVFPNKIEEHNIDAWVDSLSKLCIGSLLYAWRKSNSIAPLIAFLKLL